MVYLYSEWGTWFEYLHVICEIHKRNLIMHIVTWSSPSISNALKRCYENYIAQCSPNIPIFFLKAYRLIACLPTDTFMNLHEDKRYLLCSYYSSDCENDNFLLLYVGKTDGLTLRWVHAEKQFMVIVIIYYR